MHHCSTLSKGRSSHLDCLNVWISNVGHLTRCIDEVKRVETMPVLTRANVKQVEIRDDSGPSSTPCPMKGEPLMAFQR